MRRSLPAAVLCTLLASSLIAAERSPLADLVDPNALGSVVDMPALDEMLRGKEQRVLHWSEAPRLVVLMSVMEYADNGTPRVATGETLNGGEAEELVRDLTDALVFLTGGTHTRFASVRHEVVPLGAPPQAAVRGDIVVGRYRGVRERLNTLGLGGRRWTSDGRITSGSILLDYEYDRTSESRHLLRAHELGHVLGYNHVTLRSSIMNPQIGSGPTEFDRQAARIAFGLLAAR